MADHFPADWRTTLTELLDKAKESRQPPPPTEIEWARAYERSLLRSWARFPLDGDVYEALDDTPVQFSTHWRAPFTGDGTGILPKGSKVRVRVADFMPEPVAVPAVPLDRDAIERLLVPESTRNAAKYDGISITIRTADLNRLFRLVSSE
jgi:hypothetical protein